LNVDKSWTIKRLKEEIHSKSTSGLSAGDMQLTWAGVKLVDEQKVEKYAIKSGHTII
jgi:hypothetical protein